MIHKLSANELQRRCDAKGFHRKSVAERGSGGAIIGQARAVRAMRFGLDIRDWGFNIYAAGMPGTGRTTAVESFLEEIAVNRPTPSDWCYVNNFEDSYRPRAVSLTPGKAREFQKDVMIFLRTVVREIQTAFEAEEYAAQREDTLRSFHQQKNEILEKVSEMARGSGFGLQATPVGIVPIPMKNGQPMSEKAFLRLSDHERETLKELQQ